MLQLYTYKARNTAGRLVTGKIEAESQEAAITLLRKKNLFVVRINPANIFKLDLNKLLGLKIRVKDLAVFSRQFAAMSDAGINILQCLKILIQQTENKNLRRILQDVVIEVEKGKSLSDAFRRYKNLLPEIFINMLSAGELSGTIDQSLERLALHFEKEHELREKIKSAMIYPVFIAGFAFLAVIVLLIFIAPIFVDIFNQMGATLPLPTRILLRLSEAITNIWYVMLLALPLLLFTLKHIKSTEKGKGFFDRLLLRLPVIGQLLQKIIIARLARTLSTLLKSGVPLLRSLEVVEKVSGNIIIAKEISNVRKNMREGERIAPVLMKSKIFPLMATNMIAIGEESGKLDSLLEKLAIFYEQEVESMIVRLSSLVEPLLIASVGTAVGFIALSIYLPLFSLGGVLQGGEMPGGIP